HYDAADLYNRRCQSERRSENGRQIRGTYSRDFPQIVDNSPKCVDSKILRFTSSPLGVQFLASISLKSRMHWLCFYAVVTVVGGCSNDHHGGFRVGLVTPGSVTDAAWNSGAYAGLQEIHDSLGLPISHIEARSTTEQSEALRTYAAQGYA